MYLTASIVTYAGVTVLYMCGRCCGVCLSVQHVRAAVYQLHQRASAAVLQPSHVRPRAGGVQEGRHPVGVHRLRHGPRGYHQPHWEGMKTTVDWCAANFQRCGPQKDLGQTGCSRTAFLEVPTFFYHSPQSTTFLELKRLKEETTWSYVWWNVRTKWSVNYFCEKNSVCIESFYLQRTLKTNG